MDTNNTQAQDEIIDYVGAHDWQEVIAEFNVMNAREIKASLDEMFPTVENTGMAEHIHYELKNGPMNADEELLQAEQEATEDHEEATIAALYAKEETEYDAEALANLDPEACSAFNDLRADISLEKFVSIVAAVNDLTEMSAGFVADFIDGGEAGWPNASGHAAWLQSASVDDIVSWIVAGQ